MRLRCWGCCPARNAAPPGVKELLSQGRHLPAGRTGRAHPRSRRVRRRRPPGPDARLRRALHHPPGRGGRDPRRSASGCRHHRRRDPARRHRRHADRQGRYRQRFGNDVAEIVDGVTKLDQIRFKNREEAQAENFRKMLLAMVRDLRVILVKLADRTHNLRTIEALAPAKRRADRARDARYLRAGGRAARALLHEARARGSGLSHPLSAALPRDRAGAEDARAAIRRNSSTRSARSSRRR